MTRSLLILAFLASPCLSAGEDFFCRDIAAVKGACYVAAQDGIPASELIFSVAAGSLSAAYVVDACVEGYMAFAATGDLSAADLAFGLSQYRDRCEAIVARR
jgi:hypothetical protein